MTAHRSPSEITTICEELLSFGSSAIVEADSRAGALPSRILPLDPGMRMAGVAFTCVCEPGDNLTLHAALKMAKPGDILVCDAMNATEQGMFGDVMASCALGKNIAGLVTNGGVRDRLTIIDVGFPVFAANVCMKGTVKEVLGPINRPVIFGDALIEPGDLVIGDADGVAVVAASIAEEVLEACRRASQRKAEVSTAVASGRTPWDHDDLGGSLRARGVEAGF